MTEDCEDPRVLCDGTCKYRDNKKVIKVDIAISHMISHRKLCLFNLQWKSRCCVISKLSPVAGNHHLCTYSAAFSNCLQSSSILFEV